VPKRNSGKNRVGSNEEKNPITFALLKHLRSCRDGDRKKGSQIEIN
jgi:hypothetical protein